MYFYKGALSYSELLNMSFIELFTLQKNASRIIKEEERVMKSKSR